MSYVFDSGKLLHYIRICIIFVQVASWNLVIVTLHFVAKSVLILLVDFALDMVAQDKCHLKKFEGERTIILSNFRNFQHLSIKMS